MMILNNEQGFIQDIELGGVEHGGSRMIVCEARSCMLKCACLLGRSGGMLPQKNFEFRSSQIASDAIWDKIVV